MKPSSLLVSGLLSAVSAFASATLVSPPGNFAPNQVPAPSSTFCSDSLWQPNIAQQIGGIASNNTISAGTAIRHWHPGQFGPEVLDVAGNGRLLLNPAPRYPQSLQAGLICSDGTTLHLTFTGAGIPTLTLGVYGNPPARDMVTKGTQLLQYQGNGKSFGVVEDIWALTRSALPIVGLYYYPSDDPSTLYQGIVEFTPGSVQPTSVYFRFKASENRKWVIEGGDGQYIYISDQINRTFFRMDAGGNITTLLTNVSGQLVSTASGEAVVVVTDTAGLQAYRFAGTSSSGIRLIANGHVVAKGTSTNDILGPVSSLSAIPGRGFYAIAQVSTEVKALVSVVDGVYTELQREDQTPTGTMMGVYNSPLLGAPNPYIVMTVGGQIVVYQVTASAPNPVSGGLTNAASFAPPQGAATNEWVSWFGSNLADSTQQAAVVPFPTTLGGTTVLVDVGGQQVPAPISYASPSQINFLMPDFGGATATAVQLKRSNGNTTEKILLPVVKSDPGPFYYRSYGLITDPAYRVIDPAVEGIHDQQAYILWANGLGPTNPPVVVNQPAPSALTPLVGSPTLTVAGIPADILYVGLTPTAVGLYQINFVPHLTPATAPHPVGVTLTVADGSKATFNIMAQ